MQGSEEFSLFNLQLCKTYFKTGRVFLLPSSDNSPVICLRQIFKQKGEVRTSNNPEDGPPLGTCGIVLGREWDRKRGSIWAQNFHTHQLTTYGNASILTFLRNWGKMQNIDSLYLIWKLFFLLFCLRPFIASTSCCAFKTSGHQISAQRPFLSWVCTPDSPNQVWFCFSSDSPHYFEKNEDFY